MSESENGRRLSCGRSVFDDHGMKPGTIQKFDSHGFSVDTGDDSGGDTTARAITGREFGEAVTRWCPTHGTGKAEYRYWTED